MLTETEVQRLLSNHTHVRHEVKRKTIACAALSVNQLKTAFFKSCLTVRAPLYILSVSDQHKSRTESCHCSGLAAPPWLSPWDYFLTASRPRARGPITTGTTWHLKLTNNQNVNVDGERLMFPWSDSHLKNKVSHLLVTRQHLCQLINSCLKCVNNSFKARKTRKYRSDSSFSTNTMKNTKGNCYNCCPTRGRNESKPTDAFCIFLANLFEHLETMSDGACPYLMQLLPLDNTVFSCGN